VTGEEGSATPDWRRLIARTPAEGWDDVADTYLATGHVPPDVRDELSAVRTRSPRGMAVIGLILAEANPHTVDWDVRARLLAGADGLDPGPLHDRVAALLDGWGREATYQLILAAIEGLDGTTLDYFYGSAVISTVPYPPV
jgi:hypothetical protein